MSHYVRSQAQTLGEGAERMMLRYMLIVYSPHSIHIVHLWTTYRYQNRVIYHYHGPYIYCINRIVIYWKLLVEFSCDLHLISTLRFITYVTISLLTNICHNSSHQEMKFHEVGSRIHKVWKLHVMSLMMWTCQNNLDFSLYAVLSVCCMVTTSDEQMKSDGNEC